ncbi:hypothetical protein L207DRAFT_89910 [Hyaloscypha variabilis F]|uniref:Uncharacterized protein n=1 Tax=Hyaloscypha variabilis (strain UAMH 11265 / GT02V1 / F) TaxID=1149755 RepID=A0A2J6RE30_HYAVF|nr:hypothetical protein L207DRAFT_89910 [Hyaloscypha variabilis F]
MISERSCPTVTRLPEVSVCSDMQEATATEALATDTEIKLSALPSDKEKNQAEPPAPSHGSHAVRSIQTKSSPADSCDLEEGTTAGNSKGKTVSESVRSTVRDIKSNKIGRRTLQATVIIGILTLLYQFISLSPAFQALQVQIQGEVDSRQSVAYGFLSDCANRKSQNQPLGPDCEKYVTMTPKAPPDIDKWVIDPQASNSSSSTLATRVAVLVARNDQNLPPFAAPYVGRFDVYYIVRPAFSDLRFWVIFVVLSGAIMYWDMLSTGKVLLLVLPMLYLWMQVILDFRSWSATLEFLEACRNQENLGLPQGDDCLKYRGKELRLQPTLSLSQLVAQVSLLISLALALLQVWRECVLRLARQRPEYVLTTPWDDIYRYMESSPERQPRNSLRERPGGIIAGRRQDWPINPLELMHLGLDFQGPAAALRRGSISSISSGPSPGIDLETDILNSGMRNRLEDILYSAEELRASTPDDHSAEEPSNSTPELSL